MFCVSRQRSDRSGGKAVKTDFPEKFVVISSYSIPAPWHDIPVYHGPLAAEAGADVAM